MVKDDPHSWKHRYAKYRKEFVDGKERRRAIAASRLGDVGDREINYIAFRGKPAFQDAVEELMDCATYIEYVYALLREMEAAYSKVAKRAEELGMAVAEVEAERKKEKERRT